MKTQAFNPYLPSWEYVPDGEPHVFEGRLYLYGSHDRFNGTQFCMNDYICWSAPLDDLGAWRYEGIIYQKSQDPNAGPESIMQAPDVCRGPDGRYYLYYTLGLVPFMAVAVCDTPAGQYEYYGTVQYPDGTPVGCRPKDLFQFDPGVFCDDDGTYYLYSGFAVGDAGPFREAAKKYKLDGAYCMRLSADMRTVETEPVKVMDKSGPHGFYEASSMRKIHGRYYFVYSSTQSHELCYAIADTPMGPFSYTGTLVDQGNLGLEGNNTPTNYLGNTHGSLVELNGNWYIFYHRQTNRHQYSRQGCAERILLDKRGYFHQSEVTSCGLNDKPLRGSGRYETYIACELHAKEGALSYGLQNTPEAETHPYFTQTGLDREENGDQYIANMRDGALAGFKYFELHELEHIQIECSSCNGQMWVYTDLEAAPLCKISLEHPQKEASFAPTSGVHPLYFVYHGSESTDFYAFTLQQCTD